MRYQFVWTEESGRKGKEGEWLQITHLDRFMTKEKETEHINRRDCYSHLFRYFVNVQYWGDREENETF